MTRTEQYLIEDGATPAEAARILASMRNAWLEASDAEDCDMLLEDWEFRGDISDLVVESARYRPIWRMRYEQGLSELAL